MMKLSREIAHMASLSPQMYEEGSHQQAQANATQQPSQTACCCRYCPSALRTTPRRAGAHKARTQDRHDGQRNTKANTPRNDGNTIHPSPLSDTHTKGSQISAIVNPSRRTHDEPSSRRPQPIAMCRKSHVTTGAVFQTVTNCHKLTRGAKHPSHHNHSVVASAQNTQKTHDQPRVQNACHETVTTPTAQDPPTEDTRGDHNQNGDRNEEANRDKRTKHCGEGHVNHVHAFIKDHEEEVKTLEEP